MILKFFKKIKCYMLGHKYFSNIEEPNRPYCIICFKLCTVEEFNSDFDKFLKGNKNFTQKLKSVKLIKKQLRKEEEKLIKDRQIYFKELLSCPEKFYELLKIKKDKGN